MSDQPGWEYADVSGERTFDTPWRWENVYIAYRDTDDASKAKSERRGSMSQAEMTALIDGLVASGWTRESKREYRESWSATYGRKKG